ncbi:hypothetical protein ACFE04_029137 [Oxalis oulophora]
MHLNTSESQDDIDVTSLKGNEKYVPFDIENHGDVEEEINILNDGLHFISDCRSSTPNSKSLISVADVLKTLFFILVWYTFSTFLTLYNKTLLGDDMGKFPAPLLMNTVHFAMQAVLSNIITWYWSYRFRPSVSMSWRDYFERVVPTALGTALDVNLSNASLVSISVTFATMCKSAAPIFLLLFAFAFKLESPSIRLFGIIIVISVGILLTVARDTDFEILGFVLVMLAAVMSGFRWCMTQILLQDKKFACLTITKVFQYVSCGNLFPPKPSCDSIGGLRSIYLLNLTPAYLFLGLKNPLMFMSYVTPVMAIVTALMSLILDPWDEFKKNKYFNSSSHVTISCLLMLFGGTLAFFMVLTEYILVSITSAVTVTIAGVVKETVTILVAVFYFHDEFTWLKGMGLITIMVGVSLFNWYKYLKLKKGYTNNDDVNGFTSTNTSKYVILEEDESDDTLRA